MNGTRLLSRMGVGAATLILAFVAALGGCAAAGRQHSGGPTQADRLIPIYPELKSGRFLVLADFEQPEHMDLFRIISVSDAAKCVLDPRGGRPETGKNCLAFTSGSVGDTVVVANAEEAKWYLKRDWRAYDLLLMSVHSPARGLSLDLTIAAGVPEKRMSAQSTIPLDRGWNVLRIDLAEIGELIPLDDIQEMRFAAGEAGKPQQLRFDDIVLTASREDLLGDSGNGAGELYVQRVGRRWNVGAGGRFELTFSNGQITRWYNLAVDPQRLQNLVNGTTLGPSLIPLDEEGLPAGDLSAWGRSVVAGQRIVELNAVRAVVECEWRFVEERAQAAGNRPFHRWTYHIYPSGQVYAHVESSAQSAKVGPRRWGLSVALASPPSQPWGVEIPEDGARCHAVARHPSTDSLVLFAADVGGNPMRMASSADDAMRRRQMTAVDTAASDSTTRRWNVHLFLGTSSQVTEAEALARATEYASGGAVRLEVGTSAAGSEQEGGLNPATGCYEFGTEQRRLRLVVEGRRRPAFSPVFRVEAGGGRESCVYVNHLIHRMVGHDAGGGLLFQLPSTVVDDTLVEVLVQGRE